MSMKIKRIDLAVLISTAISLLIIIIGWDNFTGGSEPMCLFPILYFVYYLVVCPIVYRSDYKYTLFAYSLVQWIRFVLMPATIALSTSSITYSVSHISVSIWIMIVEFLATAFFMVFMSLRRFNRTADQMPVLCGNRYVYLALGVFALILFVIYLSKGTKLLNFFVIRVGTSSRIGDVMDTGLVFVRQIITCAITFTFLSFVTNFSEQYQATKKMKYVYFSIIAAILVVSVIVGERRSAQIYSSICVSYILVRLFKEHSKRILRWVMGAAVVILALMSVYKFSYAFLYSSYLDAFRASSFSMNSFASMLQSYFGGPSAIGRAIDFASNNQVGIGNLIFDFVRSTVPISFLVKNKGIVTSVLFNRYIYGGLQDNGHVLNSTAYGYIYGGFFFCSWVMMLNLSIAMVCERNLKRTTSIEMSYVWMYIMLRFCVNLYANTPALLSAASIALVAYGLIYLGAKAVNDTLRRRKS